MAFMDAQSNRKFLQVTTTTMNFHLLLCALISDIAMGNCYMTHQKLQLIVLQENWQCLQDAIINISKEQHFCAEQISDLS